jgi:hypothetical protein
MKKSRSIVGIAVLVSSVVLVGAGVMVGHDLVFRYGTRVAAAPVTAEGEGEGKPAPPVANRTTRRRWR